MAERTVERDEPLIDEQSEALRHAMERAERAEAELAKMKGQAGHTAKATHSPAVEHKAATAHKGTADHKVTADHKATAEHKATADHIAAADHKTSSSRGATHHDDDNEKESAAEIAQHLAPRGTSSTAVPDRTGKHLVQPGSMDPSKADAAQSPEGHAVGEPAARGVEALRDDAMMAHLLDALDNGDDIGHYGRLTFAMIARHFMDDDEVIAELTKDKDFGEEEARQMLMQVEGRDYSPPRRERILQWQAEQSFTIIPNTHDPDCGNVYKSLRFPKQTYSHIGHYQHDKAES